jgi:hypothetical protein
MKLSDYTPEVTKVPLGKQGHFEVRGLSFIDITAMMRTHQADMEVIFKMYEDAANEAKTNKDNLGDALILKLLTEAPLLAAEIIRIASGDLEATSTQVRLLPFPTQALALVAILKLTFEEVGGVKNFLGALMPMISQIGVKVPPELTDALMKRAAQISAAN